MHLSDIILLLFVWLWTYQAFRIKEAYQLLFNGKVVVIQNNKKQAWVLLALSVLYTASFIFFSVIAY